MLLSVQLENENLSQALSVPNSDLNLECEFYLKGDY